MRYFEVAARVGCASEEDRAKDTAHKCNPIVSNGLPNPVPRATSLGNPEQIHDRNQHDQCHHVFHRMSGPYRRPSTRV